MSTFADVLTVSDSEEDDDEDVEIISESIVTAKPSLVTELTPVEERRLLEQLNLPKNAKVKIRVFGGGNKCDLVGGGKIANCTVTREDGEVLREKSLQSRKIFGPIKKTQQGADLSKLSEILIISDEESEPDLSPLKKVTLRKRHKPTLVTDHLLDQHRQGAGHGQHRVGCHQASGVAQPNNESPEEQDRSLPVCGYSQSGESLSVEANTLQSTVLGTTLAQSDFVNQETNSAHIDLGTKQTLQAKSRNQETSKEKSIFQETVEARLGPQVPAQGTSQSENYVLEPVPFQSAYQETETIESDDQHPYRSNEQAVTSGRSESQAANISDQAVSPRQHDDQVSSLDQSDDETVSSALNIGQAPISTQSVNQAPLTDWSKFQAAVAVLDDQSVTTVLSDEQVAVHNEKADRTVLSDAQVEKVFQVTSQVYQTSAPPSPDIANQTNVTELNPIEECQDTSKEALAEQDPPCTDNASSDKQDKSIRDDSSTASVCLPPSISSLDITAVKPGSGKLFLPTSQLSQLLPPDTTCVDVVSVCPNLKEDTIWSGWEVSHISLAAALRVLDRYGDVYSLREELEIKQHLEMDKETCMVEDQVTLDTTCSLLVDGKKEFMAMMGMCRVEDVETMQSDIKNRREIARRSRTTRSGIRRWVKLENCLRF